MERGQKVGFFFKIGQRPIFSDILTIDFLDMSQMIKQHKIFKLYLAYVN